MNSYVAVAKMNTAFMELKTKLMEILNIFTPGAIEAFYSSVKTIAPHAGRLIEKIDKYFKDKDAREAEAQKKAEAFIDSRGWERLPGNKI
jgi:hypothetical protein